MFGHLKAEDFIGLIEGGEASLKNSRHQSHLRSCARCAEAFASGMEFHAEMAKSAMEEQDIPEPDWFQFRTDVRNAMLSRAAQRQSKANSWSGWFLRPAMTWGLAVAFAAGLSAGLLVWNRSTMITAPQTANIETPAAVETQEIASLDVNEASNIPEDATLDAAALDPELATWSQSSVFEKASQLDDAQSEKFLRLLEAQNSRVTIHP
jgi:hypothetical protein